jgi:membrane-associated phospholipid phosphatase
MRSIFVWLIAFLGTAIAIAIAYRWFDRPIALWVHVHMGYAHPRVLYRVGRFPDPLIPLAVIVFVVLGLRAIILRALPNNFQGAAFVCSMTVLMTEAIKDELKLMFGRTWPESWTGNNPSFIHDGVYGFNFMHAGSAYQSFPSGHMAATCAVTAVLWSWYPRWRWLYVIVAAAVALALIGANSHFLSDVIAGSFLGGSTGWIAATTWKELVFAMKDCSK